MYCTRCGNKLTDGSLFCEKCGARADYTNIPQQTVQQAYVPPAVPPVGGQPVPAARPAPKKK